MSDHWGPEPGSEPGIGPPLWPDEPAAPGEGPPVLGLEPEGDLARVSRGGLGGRTLAAVIGVLMLLGGGVFAVDLLTAGGPETPEAAVDELLRAASDEDALGVLASLDPGERDTLEGPVRDMVDELTRLEVLDESADLSGIAGVELSFDDVTYRVADVRDGLARVHLTGGTVTGTFDTDELPIGQFVRDTLERFDAEIPSVQDSHTRSLADRDDVFLVARRGGDGWRVSIGYTVAEYARLDAGEPPPHAADSIAPVGADTPEAAVAGLLRAAADLDLEGVVARLSPTELGALHEYASLVLDDAMVAEDGSTEITIDSLDLDSDISGGRAKVFVRGFEVTVSVDGHTLGVVLDGSCVTFTGDRRYFELDELGVPGAEICSDDLAEMSRTSLLGFGIDPSELAGLPEGTGGSVAVGITVVRAEGGWYVAPLGTLLDTLVVGLEAMERSTLDSIVDFFEEASTSIEHQLGPVPGQPPPPQGESGTVIESPTTTTLESPAPTAVPGGPDVDLAPEQVDPLLRALASAVSGGDPAMADCVLAELEGQPDQVHRALAEAYLANGQPPAAAARSLTAALETCWSQ